MQSAGGHPLSSITPPQQATTEASSSSLHPRLSRPKRTRPHRQQAVWQLQTSRKSLSGSRATRRDWVWFGWCSSLLALSSDTKHYDVIIQQPDFFFFGGGGTGGGGALVWLECNHCNTTSIITDSFCHYTYNNNNMCIYINTEP